MKKITAIMLAVFIAMVATSFVACKMVCAGCSGTGECAACEGKGSYSYSSYDDKGNKVKKTESCEACRGSGECTMCEGKRKVKKSENTRKNQFKAWGYTDEEITERYGL